MGVLSNLWLTERFSIIPIDWNSQCLGIYELTGVALQGRIQRHQN